MTFERWFDQQLRDGYLGEYLELDLEKSFKNFARDAWEVAFEAGENVACEGAYNDGFKEGYREGKGDSITEEEIKEEVLKAYKEGRADGFKEGLDFKMENFV